MEVTGLKRQNVIRFNGKVSAVALSHYEWSKNLCAVGLPGEVVIGVIKFHHASKKDESGDLGADFDELFRSAHASKVRRICWSPEASTSCIPKKIIFATAGDDHVIRVFNSDCKSITSNVLKSHSDYINGLAFESERGTLLASCGDDNKCFVWNLNSNDSNHEMVIELGSPGMQVCWHQNDQGKLMVAEKLGIICFYSTVTHTPIMSIDCGAVPLLSADWSLTDCSKIAAIARGNLYFWDITRPNAPTEVKSLATNGCRQLKFSSFSDDIVGVIGSSSPQLGILHRRTQNIVLSAAFPGLGYIDWHHSVPYVIVGHNKQLSFWKVPLFN